MKVYDIVIALLALVGIVCVNFVLVDFAFGNKIDTDLFLFGFVLLIDGLFLNTTKEERLKKKGP